MKVSNVFTFNRGEKTIISSKYVHIFSDPVSKIRTVISSLQCYDKSLNCSPPLDTNHFKSYFFYQ